MQAPLQPPLLDVLASVKQALEVSAAALAATEAEATVVGAGDARSGEGGHRPARGAAVAGWVPYLSQAEAEEVLPPWIPL